MKSGKIWQCGAYELDCATPLLMGVVNITPDSFSDGGEWLSPDAAYEQGMRLREAGADILDIGGESTRPGAAPVAAEEEMRRVLLVVEKLAIAGAVVSVDTMKPAVMRRALDAGASIINDVNCFRAGSEEAGGTGKDEEESAIAAVANSSCGIVTMHMQGEPQTMQESPTYDDVVAEVRDSLSDSVAALQRGGVAAGRIAVDPGIGFGKTRAHNVKLLENLPALAIDGLPVVVGVSRKSMFADIVPVAAERDAVSATAAVLLAMRGANVLRVHNVAMTVQSLRAANLLNALRYG